MNPVIETHKVALSRIANAVCYLTALQVLINNRGGGEAALLTDQPANMLAGFALELYLKGYLLLKGIDPGKVRQLGHKIDLLLMEAKAAGLPTIAGMDDLDLTLGKGHADYTFRYIESGGMTMVFDWAKVFPIFDLLKTEIRGAMTDAGIPLSDD